MTAKSAKPFGYALLNTDGTLAGFYKSKSQATRQQNRNERDGVASTVQPVASDDELKTLDARTSMVQR